jgi:hypothetical protein
MPDLTTPEAPKLSPPPPQEGRRSRGSRFRLSVAGAVVVGLLVVAFVVQALVDFGKTAEFPSLAAQPDPSLEGAVAYLDWNYPNCVRVVAAAGAPTKTLGREGSSLTWLEDGRLQILGTQGEDPAPAWGRVVDIGTEESEELSASELPAQIPQPSDPTVGPNGERVVVTNDGGAVEVVLDDGSGSRVLMTADGGSQYQVGMQGWSPDGAWVLLTDSAARLLLVTVQEPSTTWVLAEEFQDQAVITGQDVFGA